MDSPQKNTKVSESLPSVCYEIFVRSFCDSNNDGIGDLNGIRSKLDYLVDLGIDAIWLSPIFRSPSYHKYDVVDYLKIDREFGTMEDFEALVREAHGKNIKIILDFVINHTSSQHKWFKEAASDKNNHKRSYYNWLTPAEIKKKGIEIREKSDDSWETKPWHWAKKGDTEKYYGMFWSQMPDLNMDDQNLRTEIYDIAKFWLEKGVDGFRLDAAKHIYPDWEVEKCHAFWVEFKAKLEQIKPNVYLVGEVWTAAEKIAPFFRGLKANFNFDLSLAISDMVRFGVDKKNTIEKLIKAYNIFASENSEFIDATMLSNHDQERIGSIANGDIAKLKMAANLLLTLPGNPFIYYGEELGMLGKKPDENIREAFLWNSRFEDNDRTNWRKPKYNTDSKVRPMELQNTDDNSLINHYKKMIWLRKSIPALAQVIPANLQNGSIKSKDILHFFRPHQEGNVMVIQNLGNKTVELTFDETIEKVIEIQNCKVINNSKIRLDGFGLLISQVY